MYVNIYLAPSIFVKMGGVIKYFLSSWRREKTLLAGHAKILQDAADTGVTVIHQVLVIFHNVKDTGLEVSGGDTLFNNCLHVNGAGITGVLSQPQQCLSLPQVGSHQSVLFFGY